MKKQKKIKKDIYRIIDSFLVEAPEYKTSRLRSIERLNKDRHLAADRFMDLICQVIQRFIEETNPIKMDYLKWQLRKDLTGKYWIDNIEKATERAKGWNALKDKINQKQRQWLKENL